MTSSKIPLKQSINIKKSCSKKTLSLPIKEQPVKIRSGYLTPEYWKQPPTVMVKSYSSCLKQNGMTMDFSMGNVALRTRLKGD